MSLAIVFKGPEGLVLAADSRVTLTASAGPNLVVPATYDNATKLLRVTGQDFVGAVTYGLGAIGQQEPRTAHSFIPEFESELAKSGKKRLTVSEFAQRLSDFFMKQWKALMPTNFQGPPMVFFVAGYDENAVYGSVFEIDIPTNPKSVEQNVGGFGVTWGGQREFTDRLVQGFDDSLPDLVKTHLGLNDAQRQTLREYLRNNLAVKVPFAFLPLQDCVDLSIFLIRTTITIQNWIVGVRGVGGAIDVATITRVEGFRPIQQKIVVGESRVPGGTRS